MARIEVIPYDVRWPVQFAEERARLAETLRNVARRIEHNGSTSVPGLAAKPIIDIQISVATLEPMDAYRIPLQQLGYTHLPHADDAFCPFFYRPKDWPHTHHVHVVVEGGQEERRTLAFRDYLRSHAEAAIEYAALKARLATQFSAESQEDYANAKGEFIERIIRLATASAPDVLSRPRVQD